MPCVDGRPSCSHHDCGGRWWDEEMIRWQNRNDELARLLCSVLQIVHDSGVMNMMPQDVQHWWRLHQIADDVRNGRARPSKP